jgi:hypothetical protein
LSQLGFKPSKTVSSTVNKIYRSDQYGSLRSCNDALELTKLHNEYVADSVRITNIEGKNLIEIEDKFNALNAERQ